MKKLIILLVVFAILLSGCEARRSHESLIVNSVMITRQGDWCIALGDEGERMSNMYIFFDERPDIQAGDRVELVKIEE